MNHFRPVTGNYFYFPSLAELDEFSALEISDHLEPAETSTEENISDGRNSLSKSGTSTAKPFSDFSTLAALTGLLFYMSCRIWITSSSNI